MGQLTGAKRSSTVAMVDTQLPTNRSHKQFDLGRYVHGRSRTSPNVALDGQDGLKLKSYPRNPGGVVEKTENGGEFCIAHTHIEC